MTEHDPIRFHRLLVKYSEQTLTADEVAEFTADLEEPWGQEQFRQFFVDAAALAKAGQSLTTLAVVSPTAGRKTSPITRVLPWVAAGLIVAVAAAFAPKPRLAPTASDTASQPDTGDRTVFVLSELTGKARIVSAKGDETAEVGMVISSGQTITVVGVGSSALLSSSSGVKMSLAGGTVMTLDHAFGIRVSVQAGTVIAWVPKGCPSSVNLATPEMFALADPGTRVEMRRYPDRTEVDVPEGRVQLCRLDGRTLTDVTTAQSVIADGSGTVQKWIALNVPSEYRWDASQPLPKGWFAGRREIEDNGDAVIVPVFESDFLGRRSKFVIRSTSRWSSGLFHLAPTTAIRIRYRADRAEDGLVVADVRNVSSSTADRSVLRLAARVPFRQTEPGAWNTVTVRRSDWKVIGENAEPDWASLRMMAYVLAVQTNDVDIGLKVAELSVEESTLDP